VARAATCQELRAIWIIVSARQRLHSEQPDTETCCSDLPENNTVDFNESWQ
jgi:hypothetical protein